MVKNCSLHTKFWLHSLNMQLQIIDSFVESGLFYEIRPFKFLTPWSFVRNEIEFFFLLFGYSHSKYANKFKS